MADPPPAADPESTLRSRAFVVARLRLPLSAVVLATLFTVHTGLGSGPLIIVGVVVAYLTVQALPMPDHSGKPTGDGSGAPRGSEPAMAPSG